MILKDFFIFYSLEDSLCVSCYSTKLYTNIITCNGSNTLTKQVDGYHDGIYPDPSHKHTHKNIKQRDNINVIKILKNGFLCLVGNDKFHRRKQFVTIFKKVYTDKFNELQTNISLKGMTLRLLKLLNITNYFSNRRYEFGKGHN